MLDIMARSNMRLFLYHPALCSNILSFDTPATTPERSETNELANMQAWQTVVIMFGLNSELLRKVPVWRRMALLYNTARRLHLAVSANVLNQCSG
jgi:hypothetical protein